MPDRAALIQKIRILPEQLTELVKGLSDEQLTTHYVRHEWTIAQNVHHLVDSHMNSYIRFKLMVTEDHPTLKTYDQEIWAELADAATPNIDVSLTILRGLHTRWCIFLESLKEADWSRTANHPETGTVTVDAMLVTYADHGEAHLSQIQAVLDAME